MILLLSVQKDVHLDPIVEELRRINAKFIRVNTDDLATSWRIVSRSRRDGDSTTFTNLHNGKSFSWSAVTAVWYRRPNLPTEFLPHLADACKDFAALETYSLVQHLLSSLPRRPVIWVSDPHVMSRANSRFVQFDAARNAGFNIPDTLISNDPDAVAQFARTAETDTFAVKRISSHSRLDGNISFFTNCLSRTELIEKSAQAQLCPTLVQHYIPKRCEYRVTVIGEAVFVCRLASQDNPTARVDWRQTNPAFVGHEIVDSPAIAARTRTVVKTLGLNFGAVDLIETPNGEIVFLEVNPNGQWLWIEQITGARMTQAMTELLTSNATQLQVA